MVEAAKIAYRDFPTVVNEISESGIVYNNTKSDYAFMDSKLQTAQKAIGGSSDSAQLALSYYYNDKAKGINNEDTKCLYENTVILAVLAQIAIDGCKRLYEIDATDEIKRIRSMDCMKRKKDYPKFMVYTHDIPVTKNGKERPYEEIKKDRNKVKNRVDKNMVCPMNWLQECLDKIQGIEKSFGKDMSQYLAAKPKDRANHKQMSKVRKVAEEYNSYINYILINYKENDLSDDIENIIENKLNEIYSKLSGSTIGHATLYRLIETTFGYEGRTRKDNIYSSSTKFTLKMLTFLHGLHKQWFLECFIPHI